jgi:hypothetical protein
MIVDKVNTWLFYTFTRHVGAWNWCFMSTNTSLKLKLLIILEESQTWSNARNLRQHKCRPMLKLTKRINVAMPHSPYLPLEALVEFFTSSWVVERWNLLSMSVLLSLFLKSIGENIILWFLSIWHSGTLFVVPHLSSTNVPFHTTL